MKFLISLLVMLTCILACFAAPVNKPTTTSLRFGMHALRAQRQTENRIPDAVRLARLARRAA